MPTNIIDATQSQTSSELRLFCYIVIYGVEGNQILYHDPGSQSGNNLKTSNINSFGHNSKRSLGEYYVFERA